jgi:hypothetical protein
MRKLFLWAIVFAAAFGLIGVFWFFAFTPFGPRPMTKLIWRIIPPPPPVPETHRLPDD